MHFRNSCTRSTSACAIRHVPSAASGGLGVKVPFSRNAGLRVEARGYYTSLPNDNTCRHCSYNDNYRDFYQGETNVGVYFRF